MSGPDLDLRVRMRAFDFLAEQVRLHGDVLPRDRLAEGFLFEGERVPLMSPQGIFKPRLLPEMPLSITSVAEIRGDSPPYEDELGEDGFLTYRYRGTDAGHRDNVGLRLAMARQVPLVYFHGIRPGSYWALWPVYVVGDDPSNLAFKVMVHAATALAIEPGALPDTPARDLRAYVSREYRERLHQRRFQADVLAAYAERCAVCELHHRRLLDAAHILPDGHPRGLPIVPNGLALCKLHHAAFDGNILGIRPDLRLELKLDVLEDADGPMLEHGLKGFDGKSLHIPKARRLRPDPLLIEERYEMFRKAG